MTRLKRYLAEICIFLTLLACYAYFFPRWASWSQNSRLDLVMAIVDRGTLTIDEYYQNTGDYAYYNGHYYSDKAPGLSFLAIPFYMVFKAVASTSPVAWLMDKVAHSSAFDPTLREGGTGLLSQKIYFAMALYFVTFFTISIPSALLGALLYRVLEFFIEAERPRLFTALTYGLATPAFPYAGMFFSHQLVAFLLFGAFYLIFRQRKAQISRWQLVVVGLFLGWSVISEYPTALIAGGVALYALWSQRAIRTVLWTTVGALAPGVLLMAYDWAIFGSILPKGYFYSALYVEKHHTGFLSLTYPRLHALWGITFGSFRGLFFLVPVLVLAVVGFGIWRHKRIYLPGWTVCTWAVISFLLFNGSSTMWEGGFAVGPRYLLPMLPFMAMGLGIAWEELAHHRLGQLVLGLLTLWSVVAVWLETISGQSFPDWTPNPLLNYSLPRFIAGDIARNLGMGVGLSGRLSLLPLFITVAGLGALYYLYKPLTSKDM